MNRAQPKVKIKEVVPVNADTVRVVVEVADGLSETQTNPQGQPLRSGVYDDRKAGHQGQFSKISAEPVTGIVASAGADAIPVPFSLISFLGRADKEKTFHALLRDGNVGLKPHKSKAPAPKACLIRRRS